MPSDRLSFCYRYVIQTTIFCNFLVNPLCVTSPAHLIALMGHPNKN
jgi:hypothetical protein